MCLIVTQNNNWYRDPTQNIERSLFVCPKVRHNIDLYFVNYVKKLKEIASEMYVNCAAIFCLRVTFKNL